MAMRLKLKVNLGKFEGSLINAIANADTPEKENQKLQVRIHLDLGKGVETLLDELSIATMKELSGKDWVIKFESANFATTC